MRTEAERIRNMSRHDAQMAYLEFSRTSGQGLDPVPNADKMPRISYERRGDGMTWEAATSGRYTDAQLCARSRNSENDLDQAMSYTACLGIADAIRAHEDFHVETCTRVGYRTHFDMHYSEIATDEVEAYDRQARSLREIILRILEEADPQVVYDHQAQTQMATGAGEVTHVEYRQHGEASLNEIISLGDQQVMLSGQGLASTTLTMSGACTVTGGFPSRKPLMTYLATDGLTAQVTLAPVVNANEFSIQCGRRIPAQNIPDPFAPPAVGGVHLKLEDGAGSSLGRSVTQFGVGATTGTVTLRICPQLNP